MTTRAVAIVVLATLISVGVTAASADAHTSAASQGGGRAVTTDIGGIYGR